MNSSITFSDNIARSTKLLQHVKSKYGLAGLSVAVSVNGKVVWTQGYGYSDVENLVEASPNTVYRIASISKPVTTAIAAKLWEQGFLSLDEPISKYIDFPAKFIDDQECSITCRHIMSHTSGIRHYSDPREFYSTQRFAHVTDALSIFKDDPLLFVPGSKAGYSTYAWTLLAAVCESVSHRSFPALLHRLFEDLGMENTFLDNHQPLVFNKTRFYSFDKGRLVNAEYAESTHKYAGGGILSTVGDIVGFANVMLRSYSSGGGYLGPETVKELWSPQHCDEKDRYFGLGWFIHSQPGQQGYIHHSGGAVGCSSILVVVPTPGSSPISGVVVCIMTNMENIPLSQTARKIAFDFAALT